MVEIGELVNFGIVNIDKPAGPTSFSVSEFVKRALKLSKASHMGTLDPKVTGVLPVTLGRACKLAGYFIAHDKKYVGVLETHKECSLEELQKLVIENFVGKIKQTPPHRSAVAREEREREVYYWKLLEADEVGRNFLFEVFCEGGTYIRKLCSDLGEMIGGAHMGELRRTEAGIFDESSLVSLDEFEEAVLKWKDGDDSLLRGMVMDAREAIRKVLPVVEVDGSAVKSLYIGRPLLMSNVKRVGSGKSVALEVGSSFAAFCGDVFVGVYRRVDGEVVFGKAEFVCN